MRLCGRGRVWGCGRQRGGWWRRRREHEDVLRCCRMVVVRAVRRKQERETLPRLGFVRVDDARRVRVSDGAAQAGYGVRARPAVCELQQFYLAFERERAVLRVLGALSVRDAEGCSGRRGRGRRRWPCFTWDLPVARRFHGRAGAWARAQEAHEPLFLRWGRREGGCMNGQWAFAQGSEGELHIGV